MQYFFPLAEKIPSRKKQQEKISCCF